MVVTLKKKHLIHAVFALAYYVVLNQIYVNYQVPIFGYVGYIYSFSWERGILGFLLYFLTAMLIPSSKSYSSRSGICLIFYLSIAPFIVLYQYENLPIWMVLYMITMLILLMLCLSTLERIDFSGINKYFKPTPVIDKRIRQFAMKESSLIMKTVFWFSVVFFLYVLFRNGLPRFDSLAFESISEVRADASFGLAITIVMNLLCRVALPMLMVGYLDEKKYVPLAITIVIQLYMYSITGFKTYLFIMVFVVLIRFVKNYDMQNMIVLGIGMAMAAAVAFYCITGNNMSIALITNRVVFFPAQIKWAYLDYFSNHPFIEFTENVVSQILGAEPIYDVSIPNMIGEVYFGKPEMWTNTGYMADAYANLGWIGGVIITGILAVELYFIDKATSYNDKCAAAVVFLNFYLSMNDGGLITISGSGGLILAIVFFLLVKKRRIYFNDKKCIPEQG